MRREHVGDIIPMSAAIDVCSRECRALNSDNESGENDITRIFLLLCYDV